MFPSLTIYPPNIFPPSRLGNGATLFCLHLGEDFPPFMLFSRFMSNLTPASIHREDACRPDRLKQLTKELKTTFWGTRTGSLRQTPLCSETTDHGLLLDKLYQRIHTLLWLFYQTKEENVMKTLSFCTLKVPATELHINTFCYATFVHSELRYHQKTLEIWRLCFQPLKMQKMSVNLLR